ncbi:hypothetical protein RCL1_008399 [Eukaryota sp. TZLM3-RCL]
MDIDPFINWTSNQLPPHPDSAVEEIVLQLIAEHLDLHGFSDVRLLLERYSKRTFAPPSSDRLSTLLNGAFHISHLIRENPTILPSKTTLQATSSALSTEPLESSGNSIYCLPGQNIDDVIHEARNQSKSQESLAKSVNYDLFDNNLSHYLIAASFPSLVRRAISDLGLLFSDPDFAFSSDQSLPFVLIRTVPCKYHLDMLKMVLGLRNSSENDLVKAILPDPLPNFSCPCTCFSVNHWWQAAACRFLSTWIKSRPLHFTPLMNSMIFSSLSTFHCQNLSSSVLLLSPKAVSPFLLSVARPNPLLNSIIPQEKAKFIAQNLLIKHSKLLIRIISFIDFSLFTYFSSSSLLPSYSQLNSCGFSIKSEGLSTWFNILSNFSTLICCFSNFEKELLVNLAFELYSKGDLFGSIALFSPINDFTQSNSTNNLITSQYNELKTLFSKEGGFAKLKEVENTWLSIRKPFVPYIGMYMAKIVSIDEMNSSTISGLVNVDKLRIFDSVISRMDQSKMNAVFGITGELSLLEKEIASEIVATYGWKGLCS